jgi:hypothetical protein
MCTLAAMSARLASSRAGGHDGPHPCALPPLSARTPPDRRYDQSRPTTLPGPQSALSPLVIAARPPLQRPLPGAQRAKRCQGAPGERPSGDGTGTAEEPNDGPARSQTTRQRAAGGTTAAWPWCPRLRCPASSGGRQRPQWTRGGRGEASHARRGGSGTRASTAVARAEPTCGGGARLQGG